MRERTEASRVRQPTPRGEDENASGVGAASFRVAENLHALEVLEESLQRGRATCAAFNRQGTLLAAGTAAGVVEIWDFDTRAVARELYDARATMTSGRETVEAPSMSTPAAVLSVHWSNDGKKLISSCADGSVSVWDVRENDVVFKAVFDAPLHDARFSPLNPRVALAAPSDDGPMTFALTRGRRRAPLPTMPGDIDVPSLVCRIPSAGVLGNTTPGHAVFSKTGKHAFVAGARGVVTVVETATADIVQACKVPDAALIKRLELSNCGKHVLVLSNGRTVASYDVDETANDEQANGDDESRNQQTTEAPVVNAFALGADDDDEEDATMMDGVDDPSDKANDQRQRQRKGVLTPSRVFANAASRGQWSAAAFSHDAKFVAAASSGGAHELHVWERESGSLCRVAVGAEASKGVAQIVPHPTRAVFVVLGSNGVMYVWSRAFAEKWSAFEPGFVELDDNEEYVEREDEFDVAERKRPLSDPSGSVAKALANRELVARGAAVEAAARVTEAELAVRRELEAMEKGEAAEAEERRKAELEAAKPEGAEGATSEGGARPPTRLDVKTETALVALVDASAPVALVAGADANANDGAGSKSAVRAVDQSAALELAATLRGARSEAAAAAAAAAETASLMKSSDLMLAATQAKAREEARDAAERAATLGMTSSELDPELVDVDVWTSPRGFYSDEEEEHSADVMRHLPMDLHPDPEATLVIETRTARWREREKRTLEEEKTVGEGDGTVDCPSGAEKDEKSARDEEQVFAAEKTSSAGDKRKRATSDE